MVILHHVSSQGTLHDHSEHVDINEKCLRLTASCLVVQVSCQPANKSELTFTLSG